MNNDGRMDGPRGIGFSRNGKWAVADRFNHCVYLYDGEDQLVKKIGREGFNSGQFYYPRGVTFDDEDHLYITDIQQFTIDGDCLLQFGSDGCKMEYPVGLTVYNGKVYVADWSSSHGAAATSQCFLLMVHSNRLLGEDSWVILLM